MISFDEAVSLVLAAAKPIEGERVGISEAFGRVLCDPVQAQVSAPPNDTSAMDGYAVRDADLETLPARLRVSGESLAGHGYDGALESGCCVRIFTGAPVPADTDRVVIQEMVSREAELAIVDAPPGKARHIRRRGSDFEAGDELLGSGRRLDYRALVTAAGADLAEVTVWRRPRLFLLSTGDELVDPGSARANPAAIPESVSFGVSALAGLWGAQEVGRARLRDDLPAMEPVATEAVGKADLVVVTGGASVGERDFAKAMFAPLDFELIFSKVAIKPGKPVWLGRAGQALVMGLPGNPTSALVTARLLLAPLIAGLAGLDPTLAHRWHRMLLAAPLDAGGDRETFVRARRRGPAAEPVDNQDSSAQRALADADLLLRRRPNAPACEAGALVDALDF